MEDAPIPADPASRGTYRAEDEEVDVDDGEATIVGKGMPAPYQPTQSEVDRHNLTHLPYRGWCPHCVAARRANNPHFQGTSEDRTVPLFVADYCFIRDSETQEMTNLMVGRLYPSRALFVSVCEVKGTADD